MKRAHDSVHMSANNDVVMSSDSFDCLFQEASDGYDEVQDCSTVHSAHGSRTPSMSSSECKKSYTERIERLNNMIVEEDPVIVSNGVLCYESKLKELSNETTLVLSNTRELDRVPSPK